jgi:hypothetical protein
MNPPPDPDTRMTPVEEAPLTCSRFAGAVVPIPTHP